jgi:ATP synthase protein I
MADESVRPKDQDPPPDRPTPDPLERLRGPSFSGGGAGKYAGFGVQFAGAILLFLYAGNWMDGKLGTAPLFLIGGVFLGAGLSFYSIYRRVMQDQQDEARSRKQR